MIPKDTKLKETLDAVDYCLAWAGDVLSWERIQELLDQAQGLVREYLEAARKEEPLGPSTPSDRRP